MLRSFLLAPCLLVGFACATSFPIESLEEGMTAEVVREQFGEPKAAETAVSVGETSCWTYWHEEQDWIASTLFSFCALWMIPVGAALPNATWDSWFLHKNSVFLHFEDEKLVRWEAIEPEMGMCPGIGRPAFPLTPGNVHNPTFGTGPSVSCRNDKGDPPTCGSVYGDFHPPE